MPIPKHLRYLYHTDSWKEARAAAYARSKGKCEHCGRPDGIMVFRRSNGQLMFWRYPAFRTWRNRFGKRVNKAELELLNTMRGFSSLTILTGAHLNHTAGDDRPENVKMLCSWCHLCHDQDQHHQTRANRKDLLRPLLVIAS